MSRKKYQSDYWREKKLLLKANNINPQLLIFQKSKQADEVKEKAIRDLRIMEFIKQSNSVNK